MRDLKIAVTVDERDAEQLVRQGMEDAIEIQEVVVAKHVRGLFILCAPLRLTLN